MTRFITVIIITISAVTCQAPRHSAVQRCVEDAPCWDCHTMGNRVCGKP